MKHFRFGPAEKMIDPRSPERLICPLDETKTLADMVPGELLNKWLALVLEVPVNSYSEHWGPFGWLLERLSETHDYLGIFFYRSKTRFDPKEGNVLLPEEEWNKYWTVGFDGHLEGQIVTPSPDKPLLAFCKGILWFHYCEKSMEDSCWKTEATRLCLYCGERDAIGLTKDGVRICNECLFLTGKAFVPYDLLRKMKKGQEDGQGGGECP